MKPLLVVVPALLLAASALACLCFPPGEPQAELARADAVFAGTAGPIRHPSYTAKLGAERVLITYVEVEFRVRASWKGVRADTTLLVTTGSDGGVCGYPFESRKHYLVYARYDSVRRVFSTSDCDRTCTGRAAQNDWAALGPPKWRSWGLWGSWSL